MKYDYEDGAELVTTTGWMCKTCRRFFGDKNDSEHAARYCCAKTMPCKCGGRHDSGRIYCLDCGKKRQTELWLALRRGPWTEGMIYSRTLDRWFHDPSDWQDAFEDGFPNDSEGSCTSFEDARLELSKPIGAPEFNVEDYCEGLLPEEGDIQQAAEIDKQVNELLEGIGVLSWVPNGIAWNGEVGNGGAE